VINVDLASAESDLMFNLYERSVFVMPLHENKSFELNGVVRELVLDNFGLSDIKPR